MQVPADVAELFAESLFAYFPITFRPPPKDPHGVTREELVSGLQSCVEAPPLRESSKPPPYRSAHR